MANGGLYESRFSRFGRNTNPEWTEGAEATAPNANDNLVVKTVGSNSKGLIYGFMINSQEANDFLIIWTYSSATRQRRITFGSQGCMISELSVPFNQGYPADAGTDIKIQPVNAGGVGKKYKADVLVGEYPA